MHFNPFQSLVSLLSNILEAYTTALFVVDPKSRELRMEACQSLSKFLPDSVTLPLEQSGILGQVQKVGQTVHLDKVPEVTNSLPSTVPFYREGESHIKGLFVVPVGQGSGVLYVDTKYSWGFNDKQQKWIKEIAEILDELLTSRRSAVEHRNFVQIFDLWQRLDEVAFEGQPLEDYCRMLVTECAQLLGAEYGFLVLREAGSQDCRMLAATSNAPRSVLSRNLPVKQGLVSRVFQNQKLLLIPRLNPQIQDHFLFSPAESLPHHGTLWVIPSQTSLGHSIALAFLSRQVMEWGEQHTSTIRHALHFFQLLLEQLFYKEECDHLQTYDFCTGIYNSRTFEARLDSLLTSSMQSSTPFTLAVLQFEPWQILTTRIPPKQIRQVRKNLADGLFEVLPSDSIVGQISENRFGILFPATAPQDAQHHLTALDDFGRQLIQGRIKGARLQPYIASVAFPQDGTRSEELWPLVNQRLFSAFRPRFENAGT